MRTERRRGRECCFDWEDGVKGEFQKLGTWVSISGDYLGCWVGVRLGFYSSRWICFWAIDSSPALVIQVNRSNRILYVQQCAHTLKLVFSVTL